MRRNSIRPGTTCSGTPTSSTPSPSQHQISPSGGSGGARTPSSVRGLPPTAPGSRRHSSIQPQQVCGHTTHPCCVLLPDSILQSMACVSPVLQVPISGSSHPVASPSGASTPSPQSSSSAVDRYSPGWHETHRTATFQYQAATVNFFPLKNTEFRHPPSPSSNSPPPPICFCSAQQQQQQPSGPSPRSSTPTYSSRSLTPFEVFQNPGHQAPQLMEVAVYPFCYINQLSLFRGLFLCNLCLCVCVCSCVPLRQFSGCIAFPPTVCKFLGSE